MPDTIGSPEQSAENWRSRAHNVFPGKQSNFRRGSGAPTLILTHGEGARAYDADDKDYVDFVLGMGPAILGHNNPDYVAAVTAQTNKIFAAASSISHTPAEIELGEKITQHVPCADFVRFGLSGTEADQLALRLARAHTGRRLFVRFEGHYHGWLDNVFGGASSYGESDPPFPVDAETDSKGLAPFAKQECLVIPWNDEVALRKTLQAHHDEIALVIMEAVMCNYGCCPPKPGFLEAARAICDEFDVLLAFDEVITGFRMGLGGAQGTFGVTPDLAIFGKALAGGMPLSAVAGKSEVMMHLRENRVLGGGTFNSFPLSMAAGVATMNALEANKGEVYSRIDEAQAALVSGLKELGTRHKEDLLIQGTRGVVFLTFHEKDAAYSKRELEGADFARQEKLRKLLQEEGVLMAAGGRWMISSALTPGDIEETLRRVDVAMSRL